MFHVLIPARHASERLPGKPLLDVAGKPLLRWVWERARASGALSVTVATDDERIRRVAAGFGARCIMTSPGHASGTDRVAEAARLLQLDPDEVVVNLQGDEPSMPAAVVADLAAAVGPGIDLATAVAPVQSLAEFLDPNCVKALRARDGHALYFSRAPVPWPRDATAGGRPTSFSGAWRHLGIYAYRVRSLLEFAGQPPTALELSEKLEQLRALEYGMVIHLLTLSAAPPAGVDTPQDLARIRARFEGGLEGG